MNCKWMLCLTLTTAVFVSLAAPSFGQYQGYPSTSNAPTPQRAQLPQWWDAAPPPGTQSQPASALSQTAPAPQAYNPSEMPSISPFANVRSHQQQTPVNYGSPPSQTNSPYNSAPQSYYTYPASTGPASTGDSHQHVVGGGLPYAAPAHSAPAQQMAPTPQPNSYYDQPAQNYWSRPDYSFDPKGAGCSTLAAAPCHTGWYGGAFGMVMNRSRSNNIWLTYSFSDYRDRLLSSNDADFNTAGGAGAFIGHYFNGGQNSIQFVYWGLYPGTSEANAYGANTATGMGTILHLNNLNYDAGTGPLDLSNTFFSNADRHRVQRSYQLNNIELNLLGHNFTSGCSPLQLGWTAGVRYVRFDEDFLYSSDINDTVFSGAPEEVHYAIDVENNLVGFQFGGQANYCVGPRMSLFANTKVGLYGNHMTQHSAIYGSNGPAVVDGSLLEWAGQDVNTTGTRNGYSMVGDLMLGGNWKINPCWSINAGYRIVGISGVALATNQIPNDFVAALDGGRTVRSNGCLLLHGAFAGVNYCY